MSKINPKGTQVLIRPEPVEDKTEGGIIRPIKGKANTGTIVAVADGYDFEVSVGDRVQFYSNHAEEVEDGLLLINGHNDTGAILFIFN